MMETVLNVGLNDYSVQGLAEAADNPRFAWDSYRRLIQMFGKTVLDIEGDLFASALDAAKAAAGVTADVDLDADAMHALVETFKDIVLEETGREFPQDPREQLDLAIRAVFDSWNTDRARLYRRRERIPHDLGTAVNVCTMVFGNLGETSGTGVCFTRDPATGRPGRLRRLPGQRAGRGRRRRHPQHAVPGRLRRPSTRRPTPSCGRSCAGWRRTTGTCATSSSPSSAASCGCCRPGSASAPRRRRSGSPPSSSTSS